MIACSIVFLRCLFLILTLVLCSRHSLAGPTFFLVERGNELAINELETNEPETGAVGTSTPGETATALAILEVPDDNLNPPFPGFSLSGLNVTPVDSGTARDHIDKRVPHIEVNFHTFLFFNEQLLALLDSGCGINIAAAGESPEQSGMHEFRLSIELDTASLLNEMVSKKLAGRLNRLQASQVTYLMTHYAYDRKRKTMVIKFKMWTPDLEISKKKIAQSLGDYQYLLGQEATRDTGRTTERNPFLVEGNLAGIAPGNDLVGTAADTHGPDAVFATALLLFSANTVKGK